MEPMTREDNVSADLMGRIDAMLESAADAGGPARDEAGGVLAGADDRVRVRVSLTMGTGPERKALIVPPSGEKLWFPAEQVAEQAGVDVADLPGMYLVAVVEDGELSRFVAE
jgi:hypothetical protein